MYVYYEQPGTFCQGMAPVIDGPGGFIPDHPIYLREQGLINKVPIMTGFNREDGSLYTLARSYIRYKYLLYNLVLIML